MNTKFKDPFEIKRFQKFHPYRLLWTAFSRSIDLYGKFMYRSLTQYINSHHLKLKYFIVDPGTPVPDTAHSSNHQELLICAVRDTNASCQPIVEIGSYRGVSTRNMALATQRMVYAIDPYIGYGGWESDLVMFKTRVSSLQNVNHIKETSGQAWPRFHNLSLSLLYIDAVPDFSNVWFNLGVWGSLVESGGLIALATVDNYAYPGANLACRRILSTGKYLLWGYCHNLAVLQKV